MNERKELNEKKNHKIICFKSTVNYFIVLFYFFGIIFIKKCNLKISGHVSSTFGMTWQGVSKLAFLSQKWPISILKTADFYPRNGPGFLSLAFYPKNGGVQP